MKQNKILLTGYKESNAKDISTSKEVIEKINNSFDKFLFTNDFKIIKDEVKQLLEKEYDFVIMLGWKPLIKRISIEIEAKYNDEIFYTNFPLEHILNNLKKNNIDYVISENMGKSFCNYAYYNILKYIKSKKLATKVIFIHIPHLNNFVQMTEFITMFNKFKN